MNKSEVLKMLEKEPWNDGKGNISDKEGNIRSVWGYNKKEILTIHQVHYTIDPYFHIPCGNTPPVLTLVRPRFVSDASFDGINFEDYTFVSGIDLLKKNIKVDVLQAQLPQEKRMVIFSSFKQYKKHLKELKEMKIVKSKKDEVNYWKDLCKRLLIYQNATAIQ